MSAVPDTKSTKGYRLVLDPHKGGGLYALDAQTGKITWSAPAVPCDPSRTGCSPAQSAAVTAIPGANGGSIDVAGPAVVNGMIFVNSGFGQWGGMSGNVLLAFSVQ